VVVMAFVAFVGALCRADGTCQDYLEPGTVQTFSALKGQVFTATNGRTCASYGEGASPLCANGAVTDASALDGDSSIGDSFLDNNGQKHKSVDMCCVCGGGASNVTAGYQSISPNYISEFTHANWQSAFATHFKHYAMSAGQGTLAFAVKGLKEMEKSTAGKYMVLEGTGTSTVTQASCKMEAGIQMWLCKTCNCSGGLVKMSTFTELTQVTPPPIWKASNSVDGATLLGSGLSQAACLAKCKTHMASSTDGKKICCSQCASLDCYIGTTMSARSATSHAACPQYAADLSDTQTETGAHYCGVWFAGASSAMQAMIGAARVFIFSLHKHVNACLTGSNPKSTITTTG